LKDSPLRDKVFSFYVSIQKVDFNILNFRKFVCPQFMCFYIYGEEDVLVVRSGRGRGG
jgi:hypothetical protein